MNQIFAHNSILQLKNSFASLYINLAIDKEAFAKLFARY